MLALMPSCSGTGKSQALLEFSQRHATRYTLIYRCDAESTLSLNESFLNLARLLGVCDEATLRGGIDDVRQRTIVVRSRLAR